MLKELLTPEIIELIEEGNLEEAREIIVLWQEAETADFISSLDSNNKYAIFNILPNEYKASTFTLLPIIEQIEFIETLKEEDIEKLLKYISPDDRTSLIEELPKDKATYILSLLETKDKAITSWLLGYPEYSVGRLMTPEFITLKANWSVAEALNYVRSQINKAETYTSLFVLDNSKKLLGSLSLRKLFFAQKDNIVSEIANDMPPFVSAYDDQSIAVEEIKKYNLHALAVVDNHHSMLGIVTVDDILDVASEEYTDDFHKMAGITSTNDTFDENIKQAPLSVLYKKRIGWLVALVFVNLISGAVIKIYQGTLERNLVLVTFLPLLIGSGGNAGSQSTTLIIRSLAVGDVVLSDWFKMFVKEILVSSALGFSMAIGVYLIGNVRASHDIAIVVSISMFLIVVIGSLIGMILPFIFTRFNIDPATSSAPILTSICDIMGTTVYCIVATFVLFLR